MNLAKNGNGAMLTKFLLNNGNYHSKEIIKEDVFAMNSNNNNDVNSEGMKPKIFPLTNGPFYLINNIKPKVVDNLQNSKGEPCQRLQVLRYVVVGHRRTNHFVTVRIV